LIAAGRECLVMLGTEALNSFPKQPAFELVLDRLEKAEKRVAEARELYEADRYNSWRGWPAVLPLSPKAEEGSRTIYALQASDFCAWLLKRELQYTEQWMRQIKPTLGVNNLTGFTESLNDWIGVRVAEEKSPISLEFHRAREMLQRRLRFYPYDAERLERHIFKNRSQFSPPLLKAKTIALAGPQPLTP
jgi:hypothetical protein